jgi:uncharacterized protein (DUF2384 family)
MDTASRAETPTSRVRRALGVSRERMARALDVSAKTVERWEAPGSAGPDPDAQVVLARLAEVVDLAAIVYGSGGMATFLTTPQRRFGDRTPLRLIETGEVDRVLGALAGDYEGEGR